MAAPSHNSSSMSPDTLITIKLTVNESFKKLKLPLRDLTADVLPTKLRQLLAIQPEQTVIFERFSDSAGGYITLDPNNHQVFKTLVRAAKAKLKLRLKATVSPLPEQEKDRAAEMAEPKEPLIVRSPANTIAAPRDSTAFDGRSVGSGIFQFREAHNSQQTLVDTSEAPVPRPFRAEAPGSPEKRRGLVFRPAGGMVSNPLGHPWSVYCNECDIAMADAHFHCNICDGGDYDLCEDCVAGGKLCPGEGHWLIKRFIKDGKVISSTTERIKPRIAKSSSSVEKEVEREIPGAFTDETKTLAEPHMPTRTCNSCVVVLPEREFVTCTTCDDFDLCLKCHMGNKHGHHPAHGFAPATEETMLPLASKTLLAPGRNARHSAICDGCDKKIMGVRHKCLNCPDWDYCSECVKNAPASHPRHRFAAIYDPIPEPQGMAVRHAGIYCDGPLCTDTQSYITGVRYKCAVCHDTDFCASCEATPTNPHNRTHPLIKFKTPVRNVSITTENEDLRGQTRTMGDRRGQTAQTETKNVSTETTPVSQSNAATQVQTVAEFKPSQTTAGAATIKTKEPSAASPVPASVCNAHFVKDAVADGTVFAPSTRFTQVWYLRNPGPYAWPAGCSVRFVGGDNMLNVDNAHPSAVSDINNASESNVIGRDVKVGEEIAFKVTLKAPVREGKHISYWRMKAADGTPFGHRLWCDIEVKVPASAPVEAKSVSMQPPVVNEALDVQQQAAQISRMQAIRQRQQMLQQHQKMLAAQQQHPAMRQASASPLPHAHPNPVQPAGDSNLSARVMAMREHQVKRREQMMQQLAAREQPQAQGIKREDMPSWTQFANPSIGSSADANDSEKARKEAARQRVEHIKAKILRAREEKARAVEAAKDAAVKEAAAKDKADREKRSAEHEEIKKIVGSNETQKVEKIIEQVMKAEEKKPETDVEGSQMVFPKLEKESPASSTHESVDSSMSKGKGKAAFVENEQGEIENSAVPMSSAPLSPTTEEEDFVDLDDELEVLSADGEDSEDDGFLTDEEYDILDASDQETVVSK